MSEEPGNTAHLSGITRQDQVLIYAFMNSSLITEAKLPLDKDMFRNAIMKAQAEGKHLVLVLKYHPIEYV